MGYEKIIHIGDIHIRLLERHDEYRKVFGNLYKKIERVSGKKIITVLGDVVHSKVDITPELVDLTQEFFRNLSKLGTLVVIPGNHDMNLRNSNRIDALSPIINALQDDNIHYLNKTGKYNFDNITFYTLTVDDKKDNIPKNDSDDFSVFLYHGMVKGSKTDLGMTLSNGVEESLFGDYDLTLLGDIHKRQFFSKKMAYCGSLIQQDFSENVTGHGGIIWDVKTVSYETFDVENEKCFFTQKVEKFDEFKLPNLENKIVNYKLINNGLEKSELKKIETLVKTKLNVDNYLVKDNVNSVQIKESQAESYKSLNKQNSYIEEYCKELGKDEEFTNSIKELHQDLYSNIQKKYERHFSDWKPLRLEFSNMFSYGEKNILEFTTLSNLVGIFSKNASGKSSLMNILLFTIFDKCINTSTSKKVMNNSKDTMYSKLDFEVGGKHYVIERIGKRTKTSVKVDVEFYRYDGDSKINLNGSKRSETNKNIRNLMGEFEEFLMTCLSPQNNDINFIDMKQSQRKDTLSKFLDINFYDELHTIAKDESKELSTIIKHLSKRDFSSEIEEVKEELNHLKMVGSGKKTEYDLEKTNQEELVEQIKQLENQKKNIKDFKYNLTQLTQKKEDLNDKLKSIGLEKLLEKKSELEHSLADINDVDVESITQLKGEISKSNELQNKLSSLKKDLMQIESHIDSLEKHEYDPECEYCVKNEFVVKANKSKDKKPYVIEEIENIKKQLDKINVDEKKEKLNKIEREYTLQNKVNKELLQLNEEINKKQKTINEIEDALSLVQSEIDDYIENQEYIDYNKKLDEKIKPLNEKQKISKSLLSSLEREIMEIKSDIKYNEKKKEDIKDAFVEFEEKEKKFEKYEVYMNMTHRDSIPLTILTDSLPLIETNINNILQDIAGFSVDLELDGDNIEFYINYGEDRWDVELISGMEKFVISLVFKIALTQISNLPKSNFLFIDEGFGVLDIDKFDSVINFLQDVKDMFDFVLVVSHIDKMRDRVDSLLDIQKIDGYSHLLNI